jgi:hypothetical protein
VRRICLADGWTLDSIDRMSARSSGANCAGFRTGSRPKRGFATTLPRVPVSWAIAIAVMIVPPDK